MSAERIAEIRERLEDATPGKWDWNSWDDSYESVRNELVGVLVPDGGESRYRAIQVRDGDKAFIANAPRDIADLLAEVERLQLDSIYTIEELQLLLEAAVNRCVDCYDDCYDDEDGHRVRCEPCQAALAFLGGLTTEATK